MAQTHYLAYEIHLSDQAEVELRSAARSRVNLPRNDLAAGVLRTRAWDDFGYLYAGPERAAREYPGTVVVNTSQPKPLNPPYITSESILGVGSRDRYPTNVDSFDRKSGGWFGISFLFGTTHHYIWRGTYVYTPNTTPVDGPNTPSAPATIRQRRWADGFEYPAHGEGSTGGESALSEFVHRDASRHPDGLGLRICEPINATKQHNTNEFRTGLQPTTSWERLYIRVHTLPTAAFQFWHAQSSAGAANAAEINLLPSGQLAVYDVTNASVRNIMGTAATPLTLGKWYRLDILMKTGTAAAPIEGYVKLYINRVEVLNITFPVGGWGAVGFHSSSSVGNLLALSLGVCMDLDDWICGDLITTLANELPLDWLNGSRVVKLTPDAFGPSHNLVDWGANKNPYQLGGTPSLDNTTNDLTSTVASTIAEVDLTTEVLFKIASDKNAINNGIVALTVGLHEQTNVGRNAGILSIARNGGAYVDSAALSQGSTINFDNFAYMPSGLAAPEVLTALLVKFTAGTGVASQFVRGLQATAEILGVFEESDLVITSAGGSNLPPVAFPSVGPHNAPYERSPWAYNTGTAPISPVVSHSGQYTGNGTLTELKFRAPVSFLHIRRVTATIGMGSFWFSAMMAGTRGITQVYRPERVLRGRWGLIVPAPPAGEDQQESECTIRIVGNDAQSNASGVVYEFMAFEDPGMRFCEMGQIRHNRGTVDRTTLLFKTAFLARFGLFWRRSASGSTNVAFYCKGPGHAAGDVNRLDNTVTAACLDFIAGGVTTKSAFVPAGGASGDQELPFALFRSDDGSGDPGIPNTLQILTWTGDGSSRLVAFAGTTKRPKWAIVVGHNGTTIFRDPSHTGTTSSQYATGDTLTPNASTGITAGGPGTMSVGTALNANGVVYEALVFMGGDTAGNNGWDDGGEDIPVEPIEPPDWPSDPPGGDPDDPDPPIDGGDPPTDPGDGGGGDPGGVDFGTQCVAASTKVCQQALNFIGINELLVDIVTDNTPEATMCRLFYEDCVNEALREFPWDFATKYANLTYVAGSQEFGAGVNDDWSYSFRVPTDCLFPRRLVRPDKQRKFDPDPPPFRQTGADATGRLLVTNWRDPESTDDAPAAQLEYTYRPGCAAGQGDALFRQALAWLIAHKLAPSMTRNKVTAADAWAMYLHTVNRAATVNARAQQQEVTQGDAEWIRGR
jgi:hypothetical protein